MLRPNCIQFLSYTSKWQLFLPTFCLTCLFTIHLDPFTLVTDQVGFKIEKYCMRTSLVVVVVEWLIASKSLDPPLNTQLFYSCASLSVSMTLGWNLMITWRQLWVAQIRERNIRINFLFYVQKICTLNWVLLVWVYNRLVKLGIVIGRVRKGSK